VGENKIVRRIILILMVLCFSIQVTINPVSSSPGEIDAIAVVDWVIDGDTFDTTTMGRIRLADIDAPESGESGYYEARNELIDLVYGRTVYLDIDDIYQTDPYGRLVCVVYVQYSSTHYTNVNKALLVEGVAIIQNYYNEFNPYSWTLYVHENEIPEFPSPIIISSIMITTLLAVLVYKRKKDQGLRELVPESAFGVVDKMLLSI